MRLFKRQELLQHHTLLNPSQLAAFHAFEKKISHSSNKFPCIPAIQGNQLNHFRYGFIENTCEAGAAEAAAALLNQYSGISRKAGSYTSLILFFEPFPEIQFTVQDYELFFWKLLSRISEKDPASWPEAIPSFPSSPLWEFCFNGERYFVYSATPVHKHRKSRSFLCFMLAFTPRWAFEQFDHLPSSAKIKQKIRKRLKEYDSVPPHPELKTYGETDNYEYKQYFLRDDQSSITGCPFHLGKDRSTN